MARARLAGRDAPQDFDAVFRRCHPSLISFIFIDEIERVDTTSDAASGLSLSPPPGFTDQRPLRDVSIKTPWLTHPGWRR
jgi:hypothetical protein